MVVWGAIWGLVLGFLWPDQGSKMQAIVGVIAGALAGYTLRRALLSEMRGQRERWPQASSAAGPSPTTNMLVLASNSPMGARVQRRTA